MPPSTSALFVPGFLPAAPLTPSSRPLQLRTAAASRRPAPHNRRPSYRNPPSRRSAVAQAEPAPPPTNHNSAELPDPVPDPAPDAQPDAAAAAPTPQLTPDQRAERARQARIEAERLELMAAKARLEVERTELAAERKRLELDKIRTLREIQRASDGQAAPGAADASAAAPTGSDGESPAGTTADPASSEEKEAVKSILRAVNVDSTGSPKFSTGSLSDLLGDDFPSVSAADVETIRSKLCGMDTFFITEVDRSPFNERVVFRGNMRMEPASLLAELEDRAKKDGIAERVRFFLLVDPKESPVGDDDKRPVLVALPSSALPNQTTPFSAVFSVVVALAAFFTTFSYGIGVFGLTPEVISEIAKGNSEQALLTLPISVGTIGLSLLHDFGHRVMAQLRNIKLGLPFIIPSLQIGNYGVITPLESYPALRKDLFDVAVAGPLLGSACSLVALIAGLIFTAGGSPTDYFPQVPSALFHGSLLLGSLADAILPAAMREASTIAVHPLTMVGFTGLLINALNLVPVGRLDGGRIIQALYGRVTAGRVTAITLLVQGFGALLGNSPLLLFWGLVCVFLQREGDIPCRNEVIEPDNTRSAIGLACIVLMLLVLIPFPDQVGDVMSSMGMI